MAMVAFPDAQILDVVAPSPHLTPHPSGGEACHV
jgi:hypothetical protein